MDRFLSRVLPARFLVGDDAYRAKVLWVYSTTVGGLGTLILIALTTFEGDVPIRRLGTVILAALLFGVTLFMRYARSIVTVSTYVLLISTCLVFYVDFNNLSIAGPATVLWVIPFTLIALLFSGWRLLIFFCLSFLMFSFNMFALFQGWLPEPIIKSESWLYVQPAFFLSATIMVVICTRGMSNLADYHFKTLKKEINEKQDRIQKINQLKIEAESSALSKSMFLATMSHELRTPLNSVIGNAQLLSRLELPEKAQPKVKDIELAGNILLVLINDILDFSKLEEHELTLIEEPYDLTSQIADLGRMMASKLKDGVDLKINVEEKNIIINADKNRMSQVLMNLLSNAVKFTDKGLISVTVHGFGLDGVKISIADSGIGIENENIAKLFTKFSQFTNDSTRNMEGTGLGLAISMGLVKLMGGDIEVESELNKGSCFTVVLPHKRITEVKSAANISGSHKASDLSLSGRSILVVDDIAMNCVVLEEMLMIFGADELLSVCSGEEAVAFISENMNTDIILMDMRMPGMDGVEATHKIRQLGYKGDIIAVTANASTQDRQACIDAGMNDFIAKPVEVDALETILLKLMHS